jgi:predicted amidohydrolase
MPGPDTQALFDSRKQHGMAMSFGYAELTPEGQHFNTSILVDASGRIVGKYRKVHLPGHVEYDPDRTHQHLEKRYFEPGDLGFPVWRTMGGVIGMCICNDRRWPETYRVMGLQGVEMVVLGFNTPSVNSQKGGEALAPAHVPPQALDPGRAPTRTRPGSWRSPRPAARMGTTSWAAPAS